MKIGIYKITCLPNGRVYVGQSVNIENRIQCHISLLRRDIHFNCYLQRSFKKYGELNFRFELIEECKEEILSEREKFWILALKSESRRYGFNLAEPDGKGKYRHSEDTKRKLSKSKAGSIISQETKEKISNTLKQLHKNGNLKGIEKSANLRKKPVSQFTMDGLLVKKWSSSAEAASTLGLDRNNITATCKGKYKHCGGFRWGFGDVLPKLKKRKVRDLSTYRRK